MKHKSSIIATIAELSENLGDLSKMAAEDSRLTDEYRGAYLHVADMVRDWCRRTIEDEVNPQHGVINVEAIGRQLAPMSRKQRLENN
jgi:hypothetical protein